MSRRSREELEAEIERLEARISELGGDDVVLELEDGGELRFTPGDSAFRLIQDPADPEGDGAGQWYIAESDIGDIRDFLDSVEDAVERDED